MVNPQKIQGPCPAQSCLGIVRSGKTHVVPETRFDERLAYPNPMNVKERQTFVEDFYSPPGTVPPSLTLTGKGRA